MKKFLFMAISCLVLCGCTQIGETARKVSDDIGDKAFQAHAFVDIWKIETSDSSANGSPTGKKITIIGDVKSVPMTSRNGEFVKDYSEYRKTETPAWYNKDNVTKEEVLICTGDNSADVKEILKMKLNAEYKKPFKKSEIYIDCDGTTYKYEKDKNANNSFAWVNGSKIVYTKKEIPTPEEDIYSDNELKIKSGTISGIIFKGNK